MPCKCSSAEKLFVLHENKTKLSAAVTSRTNGGGNLAMKLTMEDYENIGSCMPNVQEGYRIGLLSSPEKFCLNSTTFPYYWQRNSSDCVNGLPLELPNLNCDKFNNCTKCHTAIIYPGSSNKIFMNAIWARCPFNYPFICQYNEKEMPFTEIENCKRIDITTTSSSSKIVYTTPSFDSLDSTYTVEAPNLFKSNENQQNVQTSASTAPIIGSVIASFFVIALLILFLFLRRTYSK